MDTFGLSGLSWETIVSSLMEFVCQKLELYFGLVPLFVQLGGMEVMGTTSAFLKVLLFCICICVNSSNVKLMVNANRYFMFA